jgi:integrase
MVASGVLCAAGSGWYPRVRFHDLRHTAAMLALMQGVHPKVVSDMLGHGSVGLTLDTYSHLLPAMHQQAAAAMDAILAS